MCILSLSTLRYSFREMMRNRILRLQYYYYPAITLCSLSLIIHAEFKGGNEEEDMGYTIMINLFRRVLERLQGRGYRIHRFDLITCYHRVCIVPGCSG